MPNNNMERFNQRARRVLSLAQQEAEQMRHALIGTEHMLVALIVEEGGVAGRVLRDLGIDLRKSRELAVELSSFPVRSEGDQMTVELSPATKRALELAVDEARRLRHPFIGTEHLLLGQVRQEDSTAVVIMKRFGVSPEEVRRHIRRVLQESPVQKSDSSPPQVGGHLTEWYKLMERSTQRGRRVLELAQQEAEQMHHAFVGTEHMLVALLVEEGGVAGRVLRNLGIQPQNLRDLAGEFSSFPVRSEDDLTPLELSPAAKRTVSMAGDEASRLGHNYIGTEHMLLGMIRIEDSTAVEILRQLGVSVPLVRHETLRVLQEDPVEASAKRIMERRSLPVRPAPPPYLAPAIDPPFTSSLKAYTKQVELSAPARPPVVPQSYSLLQAVILKLLDMLGEGKLTLEQTNELLLTVQPGLQLTAGRKIALASLINQPGEMDKQILRMVVTDYTSGEKKFEITMPMAAALVNLDNLLAAATEDQVAIVLFESEEANIKVAVRLDKV